MRTDIRLIMPIYLSPILLPSQFELRPFFDFENLVVNETVSFNAVTPHPIGFALPGFQNFLHAGILLFGSG
jgi:hypothetical protein